MSHGGKKARVESPPAADATLGDDVQQVKEEEEAGAMMVVAAAAAAAAPRVEIVVEFDKSLLDCPLCSLPLKPPVFQCPAKHAACGPCAANHASKCPACGGAYECDEGADRYLLAVRVPCPNQPYGCGRSVVYCTVGDHRLACPHAPCRCPEPGCGFLGPPPALRAHLAERHAWHVTDIAYGLRARGPDAAGGAGASPAGRGGRGPAVPARGERPRGQAGARHRRHGGGRPVRVVVQVQGVGARARGHGHRPHGHPDARRQGGELRGAIRGGGLRRVWQVPAGAGRRAGAGSRRGRPPPPHRQAGQGEQEPPFPGLISLPASLLYPLSNTLKYLYLPWLDIGDLVVNWWW